MTKSEYKTLQSKFNEEIKQNEMQRYTDEENKTQCYLDDRIYRDGYQMLKKAQRASMKAKSAYW